MPNLVLVIEPNAAVRSALMALLRDEPLRVIAVADFDAALAALAGAEPAVVLVEVCGEAVPAEPVIQEVLARWPGVPVIAMSDTGTGGAGAQAVLRKPFTRRTLSAAIRGMLS